MIMRTLLYFCPFTYLFVSFKSQFTCLSYQKYQIEALSICRRASVVETSVATNPASVATNPAFGSNNPDFPEPITQVYTPLY